MLSQRIVRVMSAIAITLAALASPTEARAEEDVCIAGGPGATSCSIQVTQFSCTVTCGTGYACCGVSGCHCVNPM